mgnify:FL=1
MIGLQYYTLNINFNHQSIMNQSVSKHRRPEKKRIEKVHDSKIMEKLRPGGLNPSGPYFQPWTLSLVPS